MTRKSRFGPKRGRQNPPDNVDFIEIFFSFRPNCSTFCITHRGESNPTGNRKQTTLWARSGTSAQWLRIRSIAVSRSRRAPANGSPPSRHADCRRQTLDALCKRQRQRATSAGEKQQHSHCCFLHPIRFVSVVAPPGASASRPSYTPANLALGGSGHADTTNSCPTHPATVGDLRDRGARIMNRRNRHGLHRRCEDQGEHRKNNQFEHSRSPYFAMTDKRVQFLSGENAEPSGP